MGYHHFRKTLSALASFCPQIEVSPVWSKNLWNGFGDPQNVRKPLNLIHRCRIYTYVLNMERYVLLMCIDHILGPTEMWYLFHVFSSQAIQSRTYGIQVVLATGGIIGFSGAFVSSNLPLLIGKWKPKVDVVNQRLHVSLYAHFNHAMIDPQLSWFLSHAYVAASGISFWVAIPI